MRALGISHRWLLSKEGSQGQTETNGPNVSTALQLCLHWAVEPPGFQQLLQTPPEAKNPGCGCTEKCHFDPKPDIIVSIRASPATFALCHAAFETIDREFTEELNSMIRDPSNLGRSMTLRQSPLYTRAALLTLLQPLKISALQTLYIQFLSISQ